MRKVIYGINPDWMNFALLYNHTGTRRQKAGSYQAAGKIDVETGWLNNLALREYSHSL